MQRGDMSGIPLAAGLVKVCLRVYVRLQQHNQKHYCRIQPTNVDLIRTKDRAGGNSMGSRLNYLDTQSSRRRPGQIHSRTHIFLFGILPGLPHSFPSPPLCCFKPTSFSMLSIFSLTLQPWSLPAKQFSHTHSKPSHQLSSHFAHFYSPCRFPLSPLFVPLFSMYPLSCSPTLSFFSAAAVYCMPHQGTCL